MKKDGYIYFIRDGLGHIKIGVATNIENRLKALQTANPMKLEFFYGMHVKNIDDAYIGEKELHTKFSEDRLMGEWFKEEAILQFLRQPQIEIDGYMFEGASW